MDEYVKEALDIVKAQAGVRNMTEDEITSMVQSVADRLRGVEAHAESDQAQAQQEPAVDPKKSVREKSVICLECGKSFKILSKRHLSQHGLTPQEYKEKWGFKKNQSLVAKALSRQRRKKMQEIQLWKKRKSAQQ
ncbi:MAG: MucR family transcriptional regulator [Desulfohalobiaceae bacterium]